MHINRFFKHTINIDLRTMNSGNGDWFIGTAAVAATAAAIHRYKITIFNTRVVPVFENQQSSLLSFQRWFHLYHTTASFSFSQWNIEVVKTLESTRNGKQNRGNIVGFIVIFPSFSFKLKPRKPGKWPSIWVRTTHGVVHRTRDTKSSMPNEFFE